MNFRLLKNRNFFLLMQGSFVSLLGSMMQTFALSLYVLNNYESPLLFASNLILSVLPRIIIGPFAGVFVDWFDRKKIIVRLDLLSGVVVALMAGLYFTLGVLPLWSIYTVTVVLSVISTVFTPAISTVLPNIVKRDDLVDANAFSSMINTIVQMLAPLISGFLMFMTSIGMMLAFNALSFFVSAFSEMFIEVPAKHKTPDKINITAFKTDFKEGLNFMFQTKFILMIGIVACVLNFAIAPVFSVAMPFILKKVLFVQDYEFGIFNALVGTSALLAGVITSKVSKKYTINKILLIDFVSQPIVIVFTAILSSQLFLNLTHSYMIPLILIGLVEFVLILILTVGNILIGTTLQKMIPNELMGRVNTVISTFAIGAIPIGQGLYGLMLDKLPVWVPLMFSVVILTITVIIIRPVLNRNDYSRSLESDIIM